MRLAPLCLLLCAALAGCSTRSLRCEGPVQPINASAALGGEKVQAAGDHAASGQPAAAPVRSDRAGNGGTGRDSSSAGGGESAP